MMNKIKQLVKRLRTKLVQGFVNACWKIDRTFLLSEGTLSRQLSLDFGKRERPGTGLGHPTVMAVAALAPSAIPPEVLGEDRRVVSVDYTTTNKGKPMEQPKTVVVYQLDEVVIKALEDQLPAPLVTTGSTEATLAAAVASANIIKMLRRGIKVQR